MKNILINKKFLLPLWCLLLSWAAPNPGWSHVTPIVKLVTLKETLARLFPQQKLFLKEVDLTEDQVETLKGYGNWDSVETHHKFFVSHGENFSLKRAAVFMTEFTRHGVLVLAVAFDAKGRVADVLITDLQSEMLEWVGPISSRRWR